MEVKMYNPIFNKAIGEEIVACRESRSMNQVTLAKKLGFTSQFLGRIESGISPIPEKALRKVVRILKMRNDTVSMIASASTRKYVTEVLG
jgi:ribosome-binding protein aMBF1 (putative translation factor)